MKDKLLWKENEKNVVEGGIEEKSVTQPGVVHLARIERNRAYDFQITEENWAKRLRCAAKKRMKRT